MNLSPLKKTLFALVAILLPLICIELVCYGALRLMFPQVYQESQRAGRDSSTAFRMDYESNDFSGETYDYRGDFFGPYLHDTSLILPQRLIGPRAWSHYARVDHYTLFPFTMFHFQRNYRSAIVNTNQLGFRARELKEYARLPQPKIIILGGSAVFGTNLSADAMTISAQLEEILRQQGVEAVCINLAMGGYTSEQEMITLSRIGMRLKPAVVIAIDGYNDVVHYRRHQDLPHLYTRLAALFYRGIPPQAPAGVYVRELLHRAGRYSSFFSLAWIVATQAAGADPRQASAPAIDPAVLFPDRSIHEAIADNFLNSHGVMASLCRSRGIKYIAGLQPVCGLWRQPAWEGEKGYTIQAEPDFVQVYTRLDEKLQALAKTAGFAYLNLGKILAQKDNTYNFSDVVHLTDMSAAIIAQELAEVILQDPPGDLVRPTGQ